MSGSVASTQSDAASQETQAQIAIHADAYPLALISTGSSAQVSAQKPIGTVSQLADYLISGFWQYAGESSHHWGTATISYNISGLTSAEKTLAQSALNAWHEVTNLSFVLTSGAANITFTHGGTMTAYEDDSYSAAGITTSATVNISSDWITTDGGANDGKTGVDSYGYQTYLHEIGHALGLGHQGPYNGSADYSSTATYANDTWQYSIMSYFSEQNYNGGSYRYVVTPQVADIYAVDLMYGAAATRVTNTVYGFHNTGGSIYDFTAYTQAPALTIYDGGGTDTLDASGYSNSQNIDLHPGSFSSVGGLTHNIGIAMNTVIEIAIGGSGNDVLTAGESGSTLYGGAGNDSLYGGAGNDTLIGGLGIDTYTGGAGADTFVIAAGDTGAAIGQRDLIRDFVHGTDRIDLTGIDAISSTAGILDVFKFLGTTAFNGIAGTLDYFFDNARGDTVLQGDTNGDRVADFAIDLTGNIILTTSDLLGINLTPTVIEANGAVRFTLIGNSYYLYDSGGTGPSLKYSGAEIAADQYGAWAPFSAEATSGGYQVAWKVAGLDQYSVWSTDSNGNYVTNVIGALSGSDSAFEAFEPRFQQDLNGDGVIGIPAPEVSVSGNAANIADGDTTPSLADFTDFGTVNQGGSPVQRTFTVSNSGAATLTTGGFTLPTGFSLVEGLSASIAPGASDTFTVRLDTTSAGTKVGQISFADNVADENPFNFSISGVVAVAQTNHAPVANADSYSASFNTTLVVAAGLGVLANDTDADNDSLTALLLSGPSHGALTLNSDGSFIYTPTSGYSGADSFSYRDYDASLYSASPATVSLMVGAAPGSVVVEADGATHLTEIGTAFYLRDSLGSGPSLKVSGVEFVAGQYGAWTPIGAEAVSGGYQVAWKAGAADQYSVWTTDGSGNYITNIIGVVSGSSSTLESFEAGLQQDLNLDGRIGLVTVVEANGSTRLTEIANHFYLDGAGTAGPSLKVSGADFVAGQYGAWTPIGAEAASGGYQVAWKAGGADQYSVWSTDSSGKYITNVVGVLSGADPALKAFETGMNQDLNGDGHIGLPQATIQNVVSGTSGNDTLVASQQGSTLIGGAGNDAFVFNVPLGPVSTIADFTHNEDVLQFSAAELGHGVSVGGTAILVTAAVDQATHTGADGYFIFDNHDPANGVLYWDATGGSSHDAVAVAQLQDVATLHQSDFHFV